MLREHKYLRDNIYPKEFGLYLRTDYGVVFTRRYLSCRLNAYTKVRYPR